MLLLAEHNRAFGYAAAASLALHALVLSLKVPVFRQADTEAAEPPLVAHLVEPAPPVPPAPAPAPPPEVRKPEPPKPLATAKPIAKPKRSAKPKAKPESTPAPAPLPSPPVAMQEPARQEPALAAPPAPPAAAPALPPVVAIAPPAAPAPDPAAQLATYRQQVLALAARHKRYPRIARDNGWTGDVVVRIEVGPSGTVASVKVKTSSGYRVLDAQALEMFARAAPEVAVPAALRGRGFSVEVRAVYNLTDRPG